MKKIREDITLVTIRDVAKEAGISMGTVSRAFNGYQDISAETREKGSRGK